MPLSSMKNSRPRLGKWCTSPTPGVCGTGPPLSSERPPRRVLMFPIARGVAAPAIRGPRIAKPARPRCGAQTGLLLRPGLLET